MKMIFLIVSVLCILVMCSGVKADVVNTPDGNYEGVVIEETDDFIVIETEDGIMEIDREDIDSVELQRSKKEVIEEEEEEAEAEEEALDEEAAAEAEEEAVESTEEVAGEKEETAEAEAPAEEEKKEGPITIKPKITGSGKYTTY